jgi:hypothetical protein
MLKSTHSLFLKKGIVLICLLISSVSNSQSYEEQIGHLLDDALFYSDRFITPATDAAVYQASSNWVVSPGRKKIWDVSVSLHGNVFFVPKSDRTFVINNSDFTFLQIENNTSATVPTAVGNDHQIWLVGEFIDNSTNPPTSTPIRIKSPEGVNTESVAYPYFQASVGLWKGFELIGKYSGKVNLKKSRYQVYGLGLKHNLSQYFEKMEAKNIFLSSMLGYSNEDISFGFLDIRAQNLSLGFNQLTGLVDTYQFQVNASKKWDKFEVMAAVIGNTSDFKYKASGTTDGSELSEAFKSLVNRKLESISKTKANLIGELSGRYQISKIFVQTSLAFGKFVNSNISIQYEF